MNLLTEAMEGKQTKDIVKALLRMGAIPACIVNHMAIMDRYAFHRKNNKATHSVALTADDFNVDESTVFRVLKKYKFLLSISRQ